MPPPPVRRPGEVSPERALEAGYGSIVAWIMVAIGGLQLLHNIFGHEKVVYEHHVRHIRRPRKRRARSHRNPPSGDMLVPLAAIAIGYFLLPTHPNAPGPAPTTPRPVAPEAPNIVAQRPSVVPLPDEEVTPTPLPMIPASVPSSEVAVIPPAALPPAPTPPPGDDYGFSFGGGGSGGNGL